VCGITYYIRKIIILSYEDIKIKLWINILNIEKGKPRKGLRYSESRFLIFLTLEIPNEILQAKHFQEDDDYSHPTVQCPKETTTFLIGSSSTNPSISLNWLIAKNKLFIILALYPFECHEWAVRGLNQDPNFKFTAVASGWQRVGDLIG